jgi:hypothetical protein
LIVNSTGQNHCAAVQGENDMRGESHDSERLMDLGSTMEMPIVSPVWNATTEWLTLFSARSKNAPRR